MFVYILLYGGGVLYEDGNRVFGKFDTVTVISLKQFSDRQTGLNDKKVI
jgi:hypothetical protein